MDQSQSNTVFSRIKRLLRLTLLSILVGLLAGLVSTAFLCALDWATALRDRNLIVVWLLPLAGFGIGWAYLKFGQQVNRGNNLIIDEIQNPKSSIPFRMVPLVFGGTVVTHFFGGSAGREGAVVQMAASLADQISRIVKVSAEERRKLLTAGAGAGFGAAIGAPWAGAVFGFEVLNIGRLKPFAFYESVVASFTGYAIALLLRAPHSIFRIPSVPEINVKNIFWILIAGFGFGLAARAFIASTHFFENALQRFIPYVPVKTLVGGFLFLALTIWENSYRYLGLGLSTIQLALGESLSWSVPFFKSIFTTLTVGSGFKGGEFIPLVFIGSTLGSALSEVIPISVSLLAGVGFAAVFAGAANTPFACSIMAVEIFGLPIAPYALTACFASYLVSGHSGIYSSQKLEFRKSRKAKLLYNFLADAFRKIIKR